MRKVLCFGELLLRVSPSKTQDWLKADAMHVYVGGAEFNVAAALSKWGIPVSYFTAMPRNYFSEEILRELEQKNIGTGTIHFSGNRIGIYFLAEGTDLKHAGVIYDREHTSFAGLKPGVLDWDKILQDVSWFHFSAISPALSEDVAAVCKEGLEAAFKKGISASVDLNYRPKLWKYGKKPVDVMAGLVQYCDVVMGNIWSANDLLGIDVDLSIHERGKRADYLEHARKTSLDIQQRFPKCKTVANTFRFDHGKEGILYYGSLLHGGGQYNTDEFIAEEIVDKVGTGDCFMAGLIYGIYHKNNLQDTINFAGAAAYGKLFEKGDFTQNDVGAIRAILELQKRQ